MGPLSSVCRSITPDPLLPSSPGVLVRALLLLRSRYCRSRIRRQHIRPPESGQHSSERTPVERIAAGPVCNGAHQCRSGTQPNGLIERWIDKDITYMRMHKVANCSVAVRRTCRETALRQHQRMQAPTRPLCRLAQAIQLHAADNAAMYEGRP